MPRASLRRSGFTFLELMIVLVLLGILFSMVVPNLGGLSPRYRLRTAARELGTRIESHRTLAITRGVWLGVRYNMTDEVKSTYELLRPPPAEFPNQPVEDRLSYAPVELPPGVRIASVEIRGTGEVYSAGNVLVLFSPSGTSGSHSVRLANPDGSSWTIKLNAISGTIDFEQGQSTGFTDFEG